MPTLIETGDGTTYLSDLPNRLQEPIVPSVVVVDAFYLQTAKHSRMPVRIVEGTVINTGEVRQGITTFLGFLSHIRAKQGEQHAPPVVSVYAPEGDAMERGRRLGTYILLLGENVGVQHVLTNGYRPPWLATGAPRHYNRFIDRLLVPRVDVIVPDADLTDEDRKQVSTMVAVGQQGRAGVYVALLGNLLGCTAPDVVIPVSRSEEPGFTPYLFER